MLPEDVRFYRTVFFLDRYQHDAVALSGAAQQQVGSEPVGIRYWPAVRTARRWREKVVGVTPWKLSAVRTNGGDSPSNPAHG